MASPAQVSQQKAALYGKFEAGEDRRVKRKDERARFLNRLAHKATDMAMDEGEDDVNIQTTKSGIGAGGVAGIAAIAGLPSLAMLGMAMLDRWHQPPTPAPSMPPPAAVSPADSDYKVRFWNGKGEEVFVEQLKRKAKS